jgi:hypothetical protein
VQAAFAAVEHAVTGKPVPHYHGHHHTIPVRQWLGGAGHLALSPASSWSPLRPPGPAGICVDTCHGTRHLCPIPFQNPISSRSC